MTQLLKTFSTIVTTWRGMVTHAATLDWATTAEMIEVGLWHCRDGRGGFLAPLRRPRLAIGTHRQGGRREQQAAASLRVILGCEHLGVVPVGSSTTSHLRDWSLPLLAPLLASPQNLMMRTEEFQRLCLELSTAVEHLRCKGRAHDPMLPYIGPVLTGSAVVAGAAVVYALLPRLGKLKVPGMIN